MGLHPNIVSCYYVREIYDTPTIFSEWMDGGSLESAIHKGTLYKGSEAAQQERILDIAIQFARGLHYAHEAGLIHQDVKPDNLLLTHEGEAKMADFGLANARAALTVREGDLTPGETADGGMTIASPSGGYTFAYCSMEQMDGKVLSRRTDIYSWAVSVMEMYVGSRPWANGVVAGLSCEAYLTETRVPISPELRALLVKCMATEPDDRPHDFAQVETELLTIYRAQTGRDYPRPAPKAAADTADSLNNRALSFLDLGKAEEAEKLWDMALKADAFHAEAGFNCVHFRVKRGNVSAKDAVDELEQLWYGRHSVQSYVNIMRLAYIFGVPDVAIHLPTIEYDLARPEDPYAAQKTVLRTLYEEGLLDCAYAPKDAPPESGRDAFHTWVRLWYKDLLDFYNEHYYTAAKAPVSAVAEWLLSRVEAGRGARAAEFARLMGETMVYMQNDDLETASSVLSQIKQMPEYLWDPEVRALEERLAPCCMAEGVLGFRPVRHLPRDVIPICFMDDSRKLLLSGDSRKPVLRGGGLQLWSATDGSATPVALDWEQMTSAYGYKGGFILSSIETVGYCAKSGNLFIYAGSGIGIWKLDAEQASASPVRFIENRPNHFISDPAISADGGWLICHQKRDVCEIYDTQTGKRLRSLRWKDHGIDACAAHTGSGMAALADHKGAYSIWDVRKEALLHEGTVNLHQRILFSPDGAYLAVFSEAGIELIQMNGFQTLYASKRGFNYGAFSPDSRFFFVSYGGRRLAIIDLYGPNRGKVGEPGENISSMAMEHIAFSPDGSYFAASDSCGDRRLWEISYDYCYIGRDTRDEEPLPESKRPWFSVFGKRK